MSGSEGQRRSVPLMTGFGYRPWGMLAGLIGGVVAGALVRRAWRLLSGEDEMPAATDRSRGWVEIGLAAALGGAVEGATKAVIDRGSAIGFEKVTGQWPGPGPGGGDA